MDHGIARNHMENLQGSLACLENERNLLVYGGYISIAGAEALNLVIEELEQSINNINMSIQMDTFEKYVFEKWRQEANESA